MAALWQHAGSLPLGLLVPECPHRTPGLCAAGPLDIEVTNSRLVSNLSREGFQRLSRLVAQCKPPPPPAAASTASGSSGGRQRSKTCSEEAGMPARLTKDEVQEMAQRFESIFTHSMLDSCQT
jgi:hypothetical protein